MNNLVSGFMTSKQFHWQVLTSESINPSISQRCTKERWTQEGQSHWSKQSSVSTSYLDLKHEVVLSEL